MPEASQSSSTNRDVTNPPPVSAAKLEANRRNAQQSTGPRTKEGKERSRQNALKHGILSSTLLVMSGDGAEDQSKFNDLLTALRQDFAPAGAFEDMLVEKIAICWWRQMRALRCEAAMVERSFVHVPPSPLDEELERALSDLRGGCKPVPELDAIKDHMRLPLSSDLDRILRYETTIQRQLVHAINQLERLQRTRRGEHVPAPLTVQVSGE